LGTPHENFIFISRDKTVTSYEFEVDHNIIQTFNLFFERAGSRKEGSRKDSQREDTDFAQ
jgi:hypothetical protein